LSLIGVAALLVGAGSLMHGAASPVVPTMPQAQSGALVTWPKRLIIPSLEIDRSIEHVGINKLGEMAVPKNAAIPGWYRGGVAPGMRGNAVIAGHRDTWNGSPGIFANLGSLKPGDVIMVEDASGALLRFKVTEVEEYVTKDAPKHQIFGTSDKPRLQLITCTGNWLSTSRQYEKRLVVYTEFVELSRNAEIRQNSASSR
jgi:sortase A